MMAAFPGFRSAEALSKFPKFIVETQTNNDLAAFSQLNQETKWRRLSCV
jgi:hypothetical protein